MSGVRVFDLGKSNLIKNKLVEIQLSKNNDLIENDYPYRMRVSHGLLIEIEIGTTLVKAIWKYLSAF